MHTTMTLRRSLTASSALAALLFFSQATNGSAQSTSVDPRWQPWTGCWTAARTADMPLSAAPKDVCVIPAGAGAVDIFNVVSGKITERTHIDASGREQPIAHDGCTGWQRAQWSNDERRVYLRSEYSCGNSGKHAANGLLAMSPKGEWLDVQGIGPAENQLVRVVRYHEMSDVSSMPQEITTALQRVPANSAARWAALAPIDISDVVEASKNVDAPVVEAWVAERGQQFTMNAKQLVKLADAGLPARIIDVLVAVSYPDVFAINHNSHSSGFREGEPTERSMRDEGQHVVYAGNMYYDPFGYSAYDYYGYNRYGYSPYGYGYGGYSPYSYGYGPQIVIVRVPDGTASGDENTHGRVVKGRGYHRGGSSDSDGTSSTSSSSGSSSSGSSGRSTTSSSGSSSSGSSSSGSSDSGSSPRIAKPRGN